MVSLERRLGVRGFIPALSGATQSGDESPHSKGPESRRLFRMDSRRRIAIE
jgi:hypothetical protein